MSQKRKKKANRIKSLLIVMLTLACIGCAQQETEESQKTEIDVTQGIEAYMEEFVGMYMSEICGGDQKVFMQSKEVYADDFGGPIELTVYKNDQGEDIRYQVQLYGETGSNVTDYYLCEDFIYVNQEKIYYSSRILALNYDDVLYRETTDWVILDDTVYELFDNGEMEADEDYSFYSIKDVTGWAEEADEPLEEVDETLVEETEVEIEKSHSILASDICDSPKYDYENTPLAEYIEADIAWNKEMEEKMGESFPLEIDYHLFDFNGDGVEDYLLCEEGRLFHGLAGNSVEIFIQEKDGVRCVLSRLMRLHTPSGHNELAVLDEKTDGYYAIAPPWGGEIPEDVILRYHAETGRYESGIKSGWHSVMPEDSDFVHFRDLARNHDILAYDICSAPKYDYENTPLADYIEEEFVTDTEELSKRVGEQISVEIDYHLFDFNGDGVDDYLLCVFGSPFCGSGGNHVEIYIQEEDGVRKVLDITARLHVSLSEHEMLTVLDEKNGGFYALAFEESNYILRYNTETERYDFIH